MNKIMGARIAGAGAVIALAIGLGVALPAQAYQPSQATIPGAQTTYGHCNKWPCLLYPKAAQLPSGRLIMTHENSLDNPVGQTFPVYKSDDYGTTWQFLTEIQPPSVLSSDPAMAKFSSNWTNPYLYTLPEDVGDLAAGTLLLAAVVSGDDYYRQERLAANPNWLADGDGDRKDVSIALFAASNEGADWELVNIVAEGGWQGGASGRGGSNLTAKSAANTGKQADPLWEPHLMVYEGQLVCYYSDENEYASFDPVTGIPTLLPTNDTATDAGRQILVHKTWDGDGTAAWSQPVVDVPGTSSGGTIGNGRPGMTNVVPTTDGKWMLTFEYFGGGNTAQFRLADNPLEFFKVSGGGGTGITTLQNQGGSLNNSGSPTIVAFPDGRLVYQAGGSGDIWVNESGASDGLWKRQRTSVAAGFSRHMQYVEGTGRLLLLSFVWGNRPTGTNAANSVVGPIRYGESDIGYSDGAYYTLVNRAHDQVIGTNSFTQDPDKSGTDVAQIRLEDYVIGNATQLWHAVDKPGKGAGVVTFLQKAGGRSIALWQGSNNVGTRATLWSDDDGNDKLWIMQPTTDGYFKLVRATDANRFLTGQTAGGYVTLQANITDPLAGQAQEWKLVEWSESQIGDIEVELEIPEYLGGLGLEFSSNAMSLGTVGLSPDKVFWEGDGALPPITIEDMRAADPSLGWDATITAGDWVIGPGNVDGKAFGIAPAVISAAYGQTVTAGLPVEAWFEGFKAPGTGLASSTAGASRGVANVGGDVSFRAPSTVPAGAYSGVFSVTLL